VFQEEYRIVNGWPQWAKLLPENIRKERLVRDEEKEKK